jgi:hypothetical protein
MMIRRHLTCWLLLAALGDVACGQGAKPHIVGGGSRVTVTPEELRSANPGEEHYRVVDGRVSLAQAKINAQLIQAGGQGAPTAHKALVFPAGKSYYVADHDGDGYDVYWHDITGLLVGKASGSTARQVPNDFGGQYANSAESVLIHIDDGTATYVKFDGTTTKLTTTGASDTVTVVGHPVRSSDVGATVRISGGTNFLKDFYEIAAVNVGANQWTFKSYGQKPRRCTTGAGDSATGWMRTKKSVVGLADFRDCDIDLNIRGGNEVLGVTANENLADGLTAYAALELLNDDSTAASGKSRINLAATQCQTAINVDYLQVESGPDNIDIGYLSTRRCVRGLVCQSGQAVDFNVFKVWTGGSGMDSLFDFHDGGDLLCQYAYAPSGRILRIRDTVGANAANFIIQKIKVDAKIQEGVTIVDCEDVSSTVSIYVGGAISKVPARQMVKIARPARGATDCQLKIHNLGVEAAAYPIRPVIGQQVPLLYKTGKFRSTKFWLNPIDTNAAGWKSSGTSVTAIPDASGTGNNLVPTSSSPVLIAGGLNCIDSIHWTNDSMRTSGAPAGLTGTLTALHVAAVVRPTTGGSGTAYIVSHLDRDGSTPGWWLGHNSKFFPQLSVNGTTATSSVAMQLNRNYLLIGKWAAGSAPSITVDAITSPAGAAVSSFTAGNGVLMVGQRQSGSSGVDGFRGGSGPIFVDAATLSSAEESERLNYLRQWAVW